MAEYWGFKQHVNVFVHYVKTFNQTEQTESLQYEGCILDVKYCFLFVGLNRSVFG